VPDNFMAAGVCGENKDQRELVKDLFPCRDIKRMAECRSL
jgi:hypothetical protein